jgi:hypothetical protein
MGVGGKRLSLKHDGTYTYIVEVCLYSINAYTCCHLRGESRRQMVVSDAFHLESWEPLN